MTSFGWKRKVGSSVSKKAVVAFENDADDRENELVESGEIDWLTLAPVKRQCVSLEDAVGKSRRLRQEGAVLAEAERCWEAIKKWDEALKFTPEDEMLYEMKAQALLSLNELYPAAKMAEKVVEINPTWWIGYQTLGRVQLGLGEVRKAIKSFSRAIHIFPGELELWTEDLQWAVNLLKQKEAIAIKLEASGDSSNSNKIVELDEDVPCSRVKTKTKHMKEEPSPSVKESANTQMTDIVQTSGVNVKSLNQLPHNYVLMRDSHK